MIHSFETDKPIDDSDVERLNQLCCEVEFSVGHNPMKDAFVALIGEDKEAQKEIDDVFIHIYFETAKNLTAKAVYTFFLFNFLTFTFISMKIFFAYLHLIASILKYCKPFWTERQNLQLHN